MINPNDVQAGLLTRLKATTALVAMLAASTDIKEDQWQGSTFVYPNVRINLGTVYPIASCDGCEIIYSIECYSEDASSKEANDIADAVNDALHGKSFTSGSVRFSNYSRGLVAAIRSDERTWRSEALFRAWISPVS